MATDQVGRGWQASKRERIMHATPTSIVRFPYIIIFHCSSIGIGQKMIWTYLLGGTLEVVTAVLANIPNAIAIASLGRQN